MQDYSLPIFDEARKWIKVSREHKVEWSDIFLARKKVDAIPLDKLKKRDILCVRRVGKARK